LKPLDQLIDLSTSDNNETAKFPLRKKLRIKDKIMFNIEPMPSKVKFKFDLDEN
jgi:hypothetical protein